MSKTNDDIREQLSGEVLDDEVLNNMIMIEGKGFADGVIGYTDDGRLVYSYERLVKSLAKIYGSDEEAIEWLEFNTIPSLDYIENAPIIIHELE